MSDFLQISKTMYDLSAVLISFSIVTTLNTKFFSVFSRTYQFKVSLFHTGNEEAATFPSKFDTTKFNLPRFEDTSGIEKTKLGENTARIDFVEKFNLNKMESFNTLLKSSSFSAKLGENVS